MDIVSLFASEGVSVDVFTGRVSAFNIIDTIFSPKFPAKLMRLHVVVQYQCSPSEPTQHFFEKLALIAPDGRELLGGRVQELTISDRQHTSVHTAWALDIPAPGDYVLQVCTASSAEGPWSVARQRRVQVTAGPHPLMK